MTGRYELPYRLNFLHNNGHGQISCEDLAGPAMPDETHTTTLTASSQDEALVRLFDQLLDATRAGDHDARSKLEREIAAEPAEGLTGLAIQVGLATHVHDYRHDTATDLVRAAHDALVQLVGRDFCAELDEIAR
jgi:hypothetical protein